MRVSSLIPAVLLAIVASASVGCTGPRPSSNTLVVSNSIADTVIEIYGNGHLCDIWQPDGSFKDSIIGYPETARVDVGYAASGGKVHLEAKVFRKEGYGTPKQVFLGNAATRAIRFAENEVLGRRAQIRHEVVRWDIRSYTPPAIPIQDRQQKTKSSSGTSKSSGPGPRVLRNGAWYNK
ncbi:MAG: hypothetical protein V4519_00260 [Patescibacteria group bacterium]